MSYKLSQRSLNNLDGVHPDLAKVVKRAIEITKQDFTVIWGLRTSEQQLKLLTQGKTRTMKSKHLKQPTTGYGHAVDLAAYMGDKKISWEVKDYFPIMEAMRTACRELNVKIRWGGAWVSLNYNDKSGEEMLANYKKQCKALRKKPFIDLVHFELNI